MCSDRWYSDYQIPQLSFLLTPLTLGFGMFSIPYILCTILIIFCSERISLISFSYLPKRLRKTVMVITFWSPWGGHTVTFQYSVQCFSTPNLTEDNDLQWIFSWHFCKCVLISYSYKKITTNLVAQNHKNLLSQVLETRSLQEKTQIQGVNRTPNLWKLWGKPSSLLPALGGCWHSLAFHLCYVPPFSYVFVFFYQDTCHWT